MLDRRLWAAALGLVAIVSFFEIHGIGDLSGSTRSLAADPKDAKDSRTDIAKQEIALAKEALRFVAEKEKRGFAEPGLDNVVIWSRRLVEATRKSGATKPQVVQAIKDHLARMDQRVTKMRQPGRATPTAVLNARYDALEARAWLAEEQGK